MESVNFETIGSTILIISSFHIQNTEPVFPTTVNLGAGEGTRLPLTPFETLFLLMAFLQIFLLRVLHVLPIDLNKALNGDFSGRKKRAVLSIEGESTLETVNFLLGVLYRLDEDQCGFRSLCELGTLVSNNRINSIGLANIGLENSINKLQIESMANMMARVWEYDEDDGSPYSGKPSTELPTENMKNCGSNRLRNFEFSRIYKNAFEVGMLQNSKNHGRRHVDKLRYCSEKYRTCNVTTNEIMDYFNTILNYNG